MRADMFVADANDGMNLVSFRILVKELAKSSAPRRSIVRSK